MSALLLLFRLFVGLGMLLDLFLFLVISNFLETIEIFTRLLVKFTVDELNDVLNLGDLNELKSVDSSVCDFQSLIKSYELSLERGNSNQNLEETDESISSSVNSLTATGETE